MSIDQVVLGKLVSHAVDKGIAFLTKLVSAETLDVKKAKTELQAGLSNQLKRAHKFSQNLEAFRLDESREILGSTIGLSISKTTRQTFHAVDDNRSTTELEIVLAPECQLILGDPGAGKTTTVKRMVALTFDRVADHGESSIPFSFPIIVKAGEIARTDTLSTHLCKQMGLAFTTTYKHEEVQDTVIERIRDHTNPTSIDNFIEKETKVARTKTTTEYKIGSLALEIALAEYLDSQRFLLFLDGLDEVHFEIREKVFSEVKAISSIVTSSKIIASSRYFDESASFKYFRKNEILPLSKEECQRIASQWISDPEAFFEKLQLKPYRDVASRPLFLFYLLMLYRTNQRELPIQGIDVYRQVVLLVIREWDREKEHTTNRFSKFRKFDTYKREDFISEMAFELTYGIGVKKIFSNEDLKASFARVLPKYPQLEMADAEDVVRDIETHNGLIVTSYANQFEFSHLSLQEYLCAKHILGIPFSRKIYDYLNSNPEPLALTVILSPQPSEWFVNLILNNINEPQASRQISSQVIYTFLTRLVTEGVVFENSSVELGMAIVHLMFLGCASTQVIHVLTKLLKIRNTIDSVNRALQLFMVVRRGGAVTEFELRRRGGAFSDYYVQYPSRGKIPNILLDVVEGKVRLS